MCQIASSTTGYSDLGQRFRSGFENQNFFARIFFCVIDRAEKSCGTTADYEQIKGFFIQAV